MTTAWRILGVLIILLIPGINNVIADTVAEKKVIRIAGWDVYADPEHRNKTIGF